VTQAAETRSVIVERELPHPPVKVWRALTQPHLIEEWLMRNDFEPVVGHRFRLQTSWGAIDCEVLAVEPTETLSFTWEAMGGHTVVTWTLSPTDAGTLLRMEQSGFRADHRQALMGATAGWTRFLAALDQLLARMN
jgi:uncharacterized protein YndB with AHSA1/START domain